MPRMLVVGCLLRGCFAYLQLNGVERRPSFKVSNLGEDSEIRLQPLPLIGGPSWFPLHVKLILRNSNTNDEYYAWDFVPLNATDKQVLKKLTTLQSVPGQIRSTPTEGVKTGPLVQEAQRYCEKYPRKLNLINNNCWTFAIGLALHLLNGPQQER